ncbi:MAG: hypothetical protein ACI30W_08090 [Muribaculaceae bacterium]
MTAQVIIVAIVVVIAAVLLARRLMRGGTSCCDSDRCDACPNCHSACRRGDDTPKH